MLSTPQPEFSVKCMVSTPALRSFLGAIEINVANVGWYSHSILRDFYLLE